jgi:hypothetical protein
VDTNSPTAPEVTVNSTLAPVAPTKGQTDYIKDLLTELATLADPQHVEELAESYREMYRNRTLDKVRASGVIDELKELVRLGREHAAKMGREVPSQREGFGSDLAGQVPEGRYAITGNEGQTVFVHVVKFKSGAFIVKQQVADDSHRVSKVVARQMLQKILDAGIEQASMRYGRELGECGVCGRTLTNEDSRQMGIGPVCRAKLAG